MSFRKIASWLTLGDYEQAKRDATVQVVRRFARGNVVIQQGSFLEEGELRLMAAKASKSVARMQKALHRG